MVYKSLTYIINSINANKKIILLRYTPILYSIVMILEREFRLVKTSFVFKKWIFIRLIKISSQKRLCLKTFHSKIKRSFFSCKKLKALLSQTPYVIVHASGSVCSAHSAVQRNHGGILCCVIS